MRALAAAEAVFGSVGRGDDDALSDRDVLLVDNNIELLDRRRIALEAEGSSVASYTFKKLDALVGKGALFVQHLKDEAHIIRDVGGRLRSTLDDFRPKNSYQVELMENAGLASLAATRPNTQRGALWAADVLYVATRNFGVLYLAQKGAYIFSYQRVLEALADGGVIPHSDLNDLLQLRWAKSLYRSGEQMSTNIAVEIVQRAIEARPDPSFPIQSAGLDPAGILSDLAELPRGSPAYHRLRNLERTYLALQAVDPACVPTENLAKLLRWIQNPRAYAVIAGRLEHDLITQMKGAEIGRSLSAAAARRKLSSWPSGSVMWKKRSPQAASRGAVSGR